MLLIMFGSEAYSSRKISFQTKIIRPDGTNLEAGAVNFKFTLTDPSGSCVIYSEVFSNVDMSNSSGSLTLLLGNGARSYPSAGGLSWSAAFNNKTSSYTCAPPSSATYTPVVGDARKLYVQFNDGSSAGSQMLPAMEVSAVPYAMYADSASNLDDHPLADFVLKGDVSSCSGGQVLTYNGSSFSCVTNGSASGGASGYNFVNTTTNGATNITAQPNGTGTSSGIAVYNSSSGANNSYGSIIAGASAVDVRSGVNGAGTQLPLTFTVGSSEAMRFDTSGNMGLGTNAPTSKLDVSGAMTMRGMAAPSVSAAGQGRIYFDSVANKFKVSENGGAYVDLVGAGGSGYADGGNSFGANATLGTNDNYALNFETNNTTHMTIDTAGNVGIGTTTPTTKLEVSGNLSFSSGATRTIQVVTPVAGDGDSLAIRAANPSGAMNHGGGLNLSAGNGLWGTPGASIDLGISGSGGGTITVQAGNGDSGGVGAAGGNIILKGGVGSISGNGGSIYLAGGNLGTAGNVILAHDGTSAIGKVGIGTTSPGSALDVKGTLRLSGATSGYVGFAPAAAAGSTTYTLPAADGTASQVLTTNGSGVLSWSTPSGGVTSVGGTAPISSSGGATPTISMTQSNTTTDGYLSSADWNTFNNKLGTATSFVGDVSGAYNTTSVDKIKGKSVSPVAYSAGQVLRYDGANWVNTALGFSDLSGKPTTLAGYGITDAQSSTLASGKMLVGNGSNVATAVSMSGDATMDNAGAVTLGTVPVSKGGTNVTSFTANKIVGTNGTGTALTSFSCALGEVISFNVTGNAICQNVAAVGFVNGGNSFGANATLGTNDNYALNFETNNTTRMTIDNAGNVGIGTTTPGSALDVKGTLRLSGATSGYVGFAPAAAAGSTTYTLPAADGTASQVLTTNGSGVLSWSTPAGSITSVGGTAPISSSGGATPTISMTQSNTTTDGYLSSTDWNTFNNKLGTATSFVGDVSGAYNTTSVDKIKGKSVSPVAYSAGQVLRYDGANWVNTALGFSDLSGKPTTLAGYGITDAQSSTLASGNMLVGNGSNVATAVSMSGDATMDNTGAVTLGTVPVSKGGTNVTSFTANKIVGTNGTGTALTSFSCALGEVITFDVTGVAICQSIAAISGAFFNGGNSNGAASTLGTNDNYALNFETNNTTRMTIDNAGNVGIGTIPSYLLDVNLGDTNNVRFKSGAVQNNAFITSAFSNFIISANQYYDGASWRYEKNGFGAQVQVEAGLGNISLNTVASGAAGSVSFPQTRLKVLNNGYVGIGTTTPTAKLHVSGQIVSATYDNGSATAFDMNNGNVQYTSASCGAMTMSNLVDGASYTIVVQGATSGVCTFTAGGYTYRYSPANSASTASTHTVYSMQVVGTNVYVSWISGF